MGENPERVRSLGVVSGFTPIVLEWPLGLR